MPLMTFVQRALCLGPMCKCYWARGSGRWLSTPMMMMSKVMKVIIYIMPPIPPIPPMPPMPPMPPGMPPAPPSAFSGISVMTHCNKQACQNKIIG